MSLCIKFSAGLLQGGLDHFSWFCWDFLQHYLILFHFICDCSADKLDVEVPLFVPHPLIQPFTFLLAVCFSMPAHVHFSGVTCKHWSSLEPKYLFVTFSDTTVHTLGLLLHSGLFDNYFQGEVYVWSKGPLNKLFLNVAVASLYGGFNHEQFV